MDVSQLAQVSTVNTSERAADGPFASIHKQLSFVVHIARAIMAIISKIDAINTASAVASRQTATRIILLADDKNYIPFSVLTAITTLPVSKDQLDIYLDGAPVADAEYALHQLGITFATALTTGQRLDVTVLSPELAAGRKRFWYNGDTGAGTGCRTWALKSLAADTKANQITKFPAIVSNLEVWLNGILVTTAGASPDYTVAGLGSNMVVSFVSTYNLTSTDIVSFVIWSA
jgi:hypothetical protein